MRKWLCFVVVMGVLLLAGSAQAVVYVSKSGNDLNSGASWKDAKATIQAGVDAAAAKPNADSVWVRWGTYYELVTLKPGVSLIGGCLGQGLTRNWLKYPTIIDAWYAGSAVTVIGPDNYLPTRTAIDGFTIRHGSASYGGGIFMSTGWPNLVVKNCKITENTATYGGGIGSEVASFAGTIKLLNSFVTNNSASYGGGIHLNADQVNIATFTTANTLFTGNQAGQGGAMYVRKTRTRLVNCTLSDNTADAGGAVYWTWEQFSAGNSIFAFNSAPEGGVIASEKLESTVFTRCCFYSNGSDPYHRYPDPWGPVDVNPIGINRNFYANPLFVSRASGNYHLWYYQTFLRSPCVDTGDRTLLDPDWTTDLDGNPRIVGKVDIGCYEVQY